MESDLDMPKKIFRRERLQQILERIKKEHKAYVEELAEYFKVSASSIRLDLAELEKMGLITRIYGGAVLPEYSIENIMNSSFDIEYRPNLEMRSQKYYKEKEAIGRLAASFVEDGDTILIDGGSTTQFLVKNIINRKGLTIVTNSLPHIPDLLKIQDIEIYLVGGLIYPENLVLAGNFATDSLKQIHVRKSFLGIDGISLEGGLTASNPHASEFVSIKKKMIEISDIHYFLSDFSKLGITCLMPIAPLEEMDYLITDANAPMDIVEQLKSLGVIVEIAEIEMA